MGLPPTTLNPAFLLQDIRVGIWLVVIFVLMETAVRFAVRGKKSEVKNLSRYLYGVSIFFALYTCTRVFFLLSDIFASIDFIFQILWRLATICGLIGFLILIFFIEYYLLNRRTKLIFTIVGIIITTITVALGQISFQTFNPLSLGLIIIALIPFLLYGYFLVKSEGDIRHRAGMALGGLGLFFGGIGLDGTLVQSILLPLCIPSKILGGIVVIIGLILFQFAYAGEN